MSATDAVLAFDLGTGACKASLWNSAGECLAETVHDYPTHHPASGYNEQDVDAWWSAVKAATQQLVADRAPAIAGIALSGQSLGIVALDAEMKPIRSHTPIWSDTRAGPLVRAMFDMRQEEDWYLRTGNGFPAALYPSAKSLWFAQHEPALWDRVRHVLGSKDYINYLLTGEVCTDHSYASGSGVYDLESGAYAQDLLDRTALTMNMMPDIVAATDVIGTLSGPAAQALGLPAGVPVFAGAVDNACMALGSRGTGPGRAYMALGSSSWITVVADEPILDLESRPFVFAHAIPGLYISALSTFSTGSTIAWLQQLVAGDLTMSQFVSLGLDADSEGLIFVPILSGGTPSEGGTNVKGAIHGLTLGHDRAHLARSVMEGIALALKRALRLLEQHTLVDDTLLVTGGGSRNDGWNQLYTDVLQRPLVRTNINQQAATLGAASLAFVGLGLWRTFDELDRVHEVEATYHPARHQADHYRAKAARYERLLQCAPEDLP